MAYEHREGQGSLFRNDKGDNEKRPDYRGSIMIGGVIYELSGWIQTAQTSGKQYMSLKAKEKQEKPPVQAEAPLSPSKQAERAADFDDKIPF